MVLLLQARSGMQKAKTALHQYQTLQGKLDASREISDFIKQRRELLKETLGQYNTWVNTWRNTIKPVITMLRQ
jgi:hypothetical protein